MMTRDATELTAAAEAWAQQLRAKGVPADVVPGDSTVGGGSLPGNTLQTALVKIAVAGPDGVLARLRQYDPPVIARIAADAVVLDPRTVLRDQVEDLLAAVVAAVNPQSVSNERNTP
jgi:L-seryl-tRNA(Ser) seleniumtransferase